MTLDEFSSYAKEKLNINSLRYTGNSDAVINKVAMIGGSGIGFSMKLTVMVQMYLLLEISNITMH